MLIEMQDGGIKAVRYDQTHSSGCDTCDYGSSYIDEYDIEMTQGTIHVEVDQMYEYFLSEGYMMQLLIQNVDSIRQMTEDDFCTWLESEINKKKDSEYNSVETVQVTFKK